MQQNGSAMKLQPPASTNSDDENYEEDFSDGNDADEGIDEMEKIRNAMAREKAKAEKFHERAQERQQQ